MATSYLYQSRLTWSVKPPRSYHYLCATSWQGTNNGKNKSLAEERVYGVRSVSATTGRSRYLDHHTASMWICCVAVILLTLRPSDQAPLRCVQPLLHDPVQQRPSREHGDALWQAACRPGPVLLAAQHQQACVTCGAIQRVLCSCCQQLPEWMQCIVGSGQMKDELQHCRSSHACYCSKH